MQNIVVFINNNIAFFVIISLILNFIFIILTMLLNMTTTNLKNKYKRLTKGTTGKNIENILMDYIEKADDVEKKLSAAFNEIENLNNRFSFCVQKIGVIRYNAFENTGSDLSYSIALLNESNDGVVLTGIHGRAETVSFAKPIINGESSYNLSAEEIQALDRAKDNAIDRAKVKGTERCVQDFSGRLLDKQG